MIKKYSKLATNSIFKQLYTFFLWKKIFFIFFFKSEVQLVQMYQKASNTNDLRVARTWITYLNLYFIKAGVYKGYDQEEEIKI